MAHRVGDDDGLFVGLNFWGGPSYVHGQGYIQASNNGQIQHTAWPLVECKNEQARLDERLAWITPNGEQWIDEARHMTAVVADDTNWYLDFKFRLTNVGRRLNLAHPPRRVVRTRVMGACFGGGRWRGETPKWVFSRSRY